MFSTSHGTSPTCDKCPAGTYSAQPGAAVCMRCAAGYSTAGEDGATCCARCDAGTYVDDGRVGCRALKAANAWWTFLPPASATSGRAWRLRYAHAYPKGAKATAQRCVDIASSDPVAACGSRCAADETCNAFWAHTRGADVGRCCMKESYTFTEARHLLVHSTDGSFYDMVSPGGKCRYYVSAAQHTWGTWCPGRKPWAAADAWCRNLGGRLPTIEELYDDKALAGIGNARHDSAELFSRLKALHCTAKMDWNLIPRDVLFTSSSGLPL